jgi:hypothetical protein
VEAGEEIKPESPFTYESTHLFPVEGDGSWIAQESLYYSARKMKSGDPRNYKDKSNKDSYVLGEVAFNMDRLQNLVEYLPKGNNGDSNNPKQHFVVRLLVSVTALDGFSTSSESRQSGIRRTIHPFFTPI